MQYVFGAVIVVFALWCLFIFALAIWELLLHTVAAIMRALVHVLARLERKARPSGYDPERPLATSTPRKYT